MKKNIKKDCIALGIIFGLASLGWWWVCKEFQKPPKPKEVISTRIFSENPVKIYSGAWQKGGYLEVQK